MLERTSGPSGWAELEGERYEIGGWELFEGDAESPHMCRGWFHFDPKAFVAHVGTSVHLHLTDEDRTRKLLKAQLLKARTTAPEWEFCAER